MRFLTIFVLLIILIVILGSLALFLAPLQKESVDFNMEIKKLTVNQNLKEK